jgi:hypothetical protein
MNIILPHKQKKLATIGQPTNHPNPQQRKSFKEKTCQRRLKKSQMTFYKPLSPVKSPESSSVSKQKNSLFTVKITFPFLVVIPTKDIWKD